MIEFNRYYGQFQGFRGKVTGLPGWARLIVGLFALPGLVLLALSILAIVVSFLALLVLTAPVYAVLRSITTGRRSSHDHFEPGSTAPGAKHVEARVIE
jgi:hypothetical protein